MAPNASVKSTRVSAIGRQCRRGCELGEGGQAEGEARARRSGAEVEDEREEHEAQGLHVRVPGGLDDQQRGPEVEDCHATRAPSGPARHPHEEERGQKIERHPHQLQAQDRPSQEGVQEEDDLSKGG